MATTKKNNYLDMELEWLEMKAEELRAFVDSNPINSITDRMAYRTVRGGGQIPVCIATIEQQQKNIRETLKDYTLIVEAIGKLREKEEEKKMSVRGDQDLTPFEEGDLQ